MTLLSFLLCRMFPYCQPVSRYHKYTRNHPRNSVDIEQYVVSSPYRRHTIHPDDTKHASTYYSHQSRSKRFSHSSQGRTRSLVTASNELKRQYNVHSYASEVLYHGHIREEAQKETMLPGEYPTESGAESGTCSHTAPETPVSPVRLSGSVV